MQPVYFFSCLYCFKKDRQSNIKNHRCIRLWISCCTCKKEFTNDRYLKHKNCILDKKQTSESKLQFWEFTSKQILKEQNDVEPHIQDVLDKVEAKRTFVPMHWRYFKSFLGNLSPCISYEHTVIVHNLFMSRYIKNQLLYEKFLQSPDDEKLQKYFEDFKLKPPKAEIEEAKKRKMDVDEEIIVQEESKPKKMKVNKKDGTTDTSSTRVLRSSSRKSENINRTIALNGNKKIGKKIKQ